MKDILFLRTLAAGSTTHLRTNFQSRKKIQDRMRRNHLQGILDKFYLLTLYLIVEKFNFTRFSAAPNNESARLSHQRYQNLFTATLQSMLYSWSCFFNFCLTLRYHLIIKKRPWNFNAPRRRISFREKKEDSEMSDSDTETLRDRLKINVSKLVDTHVTPFWHIFPRSFKFNWTWHFLLLPQILA